MVALTDQTPRDAGVVEESVGSRIQPVSRTRAQDEVARQLRELMQQGVLRPGHRLPPERELAKRFGVSRATIRQALSVLQAVGLVESRVGDGTFTRRDPATLNVTNLASALRAAQASLIDQLELRRLIEPQVASLAAERANQSDLEEMSRHLSEQKAHTEDSLFIDADSAFHLVIASATKNKLLAKMVQSIHELLKESRELSWRAHGGARPLEQHQSIYDAIRRHDSDAACIAMMDHVLGVERLSLEAIAEFEAR
ncbi:MAG TPA: FadR/GntR family transcriptional regulator [Nocardioidaceae bacterium]|nr:FadR/GntR family transcriptional regulator [Nocardioidaceae bacterium]